MPLPRTLNAVMEAAMTQGLWLIGLPIISRLYSVGAVGQLGVFLAYAGFLSTVVSLRSDISILSCKAGEERVVRFAALMIGAAISLLLLLAVAVLSLIGRPFPFEFVSYNVLVVVGAFGIFLYTLMGAALAKVDDFPALRNTAGVRGLLQIVAQISAYSLGPVGLIGSRLSADFAGAFLRMKRLASLREAGASLPSMGAMVSAIKGQRRVYYYSFPQTLANSFSQYLPVLLLASRVSQNWMGYYTLAFTLAVAPVALIGTPIRRLLIRDYSAQDEGSARAAAIKYTVGLFSISVAAYLLYVLVSDALLGLVFGEKWIPMTDFLNYLLLWSLTGLANTPAIAVLLAFGRNREHLIFEMVSLGLRGVAIWTGINYFSGANIIAPFAVAGVLVNIVLIGWALLRKRHRA